MGSKFGLKPIYNFWMVVCQSCSFFLAHLVLSGHPRVLVSRHAKPPSYKERWNNVQGNSQSTFHQLPPDHPVDTLTMWWSKRVDCFILLTLLLVHGLHVLTCTCVVCSSCHSVLGRTAQGGGYSLQVGSEVKAVGVLALLTFELHSQKTALSDILLALRPRWSHSGRVLRNTSWGRFTIDLITGWRGGTLRG